ncbi:hypothetical protein BJQ90_00840 [Arthrobacter sp. SO3]|nr:hypothetical protein [Arthrobacter sp. SO3]
MYAWQYSLKMVQWDVPVPAAVKHGLTFSSGSGLVCQEYFGNTPHPGWVTTQPKPTRYTTTLILDQTDQGAEMGLRIPSFADM